MDAASGDSGCNRCGAALPADYGRPARVPCPFCGAPAPRTHGLTRSHGAVTAPGPRPVAEPVLTWFGRPVPYLRRIPR